MSISNAEMSVRIVDPSVIRPGQKVRCCLDGEDPMYESDQDGEPTDDLDWYTGIVRSISKESDSDYWHLTIERQEKYSDGHSLWNISLYEDIFEYIRLLIKEWDD